MSNNRNRNRASQKANAGSPFEFIHDGKVYRLPSSKPAVENMRAGDLIDAVMDDSQDGQVKLAMRTLMASNPDPDAIAAMRRMKINDFAHTLKRWFQAGNVEPGKSGSSST